MKALLNFALVLIGIMIDYLKIFLADVVFLLNAVLRNARVARVSVPYGSDVLCCSRAQCALRLADVHCVTVTTRDSVHNVH